MTDITPIYIQLADELRKQIRDETFAKGTKIPSENALHESTGYSRSTVRKAIEILVKEKLLTKVHGKGTFVTQQTPPSEQTHHFLSFTENVERQGQTLTTKTVDLRWVTPDLQQQAFFGISEEDQLLEIIRLRSIDGVPICVETDWFTKEFASLEQEDLDRSIYQILTQKFGITPTTGKKTFEISYTTPQEAFLLDIPRGTALMLIEDHVYSNYGQPLHISKQVLRGDKFKYAVIE